MSIASNAGQDLISGSGPDKWLGIFVVDFNELANRRFEILHAAKHAAPNPFVGEFREPALDQVDPGTIRGCEVNVKVWALGEPVPDDRGFVRAVVVDNQMSIETGRHLSFDQVQELAKLHRTVTVA